MLKPVLSLCLAGAMCAPVALAGETVPVTVAISYDASQLATDAGAARELDLIKRQARRACSFNEAVSAARTIDRVCVDGLVSGAVTQIREKLANEGGAVSPAFAASDRMLLAQTGQR